MCLCREIWLLNMLRSDNNQIKLTSAMTIKMTPTGKNSLWIPTTISGVVVFDVVLSCNKE